LTQGHHFAPLALVTPVHPQCIAAMAAEGWAAVWQPAGHTVAALVQEEQAE